MRTWGQSARTLILVSYFTLHAVAAIGAKKAEVVYVKAVYSLPVSFDPVKMNDTASLLFSELIYEGLLRLRPDFGFEGAIAESWSTDKTGRTITFKIRKDVFFHDGQRIIADDVVASLSRAVAPDSKVFDYYSSIDGAEDFHSNKSKSVRGLKAVGSDTVQIQLSEPFPPIMYVLAGATAKILPRSVSSPDFFKQPVGSGPFQFSSQSEKEIILRRHRAHPDSKTNIDVFKLRTSDEREARDNALKGVVHDLANWPLTGNEDVFKTGQHVSSIVANTWIIGLNSRKSPFQNISVRRAFKESFDTEKFRKRFYPDAAASYGFVPPGFPGSKNTASKATKSKARTDVLIEIAVPKGLSEESAMKEFIEAEFKAKGWNVSVRLMEWPDLMDAYQKKTLQSFLVAMNVDYPDAEFLLRNFQSSNPGNFSGIRDQSIDRQLSTAREIVDRMKREKIYRDVSDRVDSLAPTINLFHPRAHVWLHKCVRKFTPSLLSDVYIQYRNVQLDEDCMEQAKVSP